MPGLTKKEFLNTPEGKIRRYCYNKQYELIIKLPIGLKSKNSFKKNEKENFKKQILKELKKQKRRAFRGKIYMEITFTTKIDNQVHIHTLSKNYLDLLKNIIYKDDSQIAILSVKHKLVENEVFDSLIKDLILSSNDSILNNLFLENQNIVKSENFKESIEIRALSLNKFIENFLIAYSLYNELKDKFQAKDILTDLVEEIYNKIFDYEDIMFNFHLFFNLFKDLLSILCIFKKNKNNAKFINEIKNNLRKFYSEIQLTNFTRLNLETINLLLTKNWNILELCKKIRYNLIEVDILDIKKSISKRQIKNQVQNQLKHLKDKFQKNFNIQFPLNIPICLTIFVSRSFINKSKIDLDNLVSEAIIKPILTIVQPPAVLRLNWEKFKPLIEKLLPSLKDKYFTLLDSLNKHSKRTMIRSYIIFSINNENFPKNKIYFFFNYLRDDFSLLNTLDSIVYKAINYLDENFCF